MGKENNKYCQHCDRALNNSLICSEYCNFIEFDADENKKDYNCNICGKSYPSRKAAKGHVFANHPDLQSQTNLSRELTLSKTNFEIESYTEKSRKKSSPNKSEFVKSNFDIMNEGGGGKLDNFNQSGAANNLKDNSLNMRTCKFCRREFLKKGIGAHERNCQKKPANSNDNDTSHGNDAVTNNQMDNSQKVLENVKGDIYMTILIFLSFLKCFKVLGNKSVTKKKKQFICDICNYEGLKPIDLKKHSEKCQKYHKFIIDMWTCKLCNKECHKGKVFQHLETHHKKIIDAEISKTAEESSENSNFNQETDIITNLILQPEKSALVVPKSGKCEAKNIHEKVKKPSKVTKKARMRREMENSNFNQESDDTNLNLQPQKSALVIAESEKSEAKNNHEKVNKTVEEMESEFETNKYSALDLTLNDSMNNQTDTSSNFSKNEKSILKQFYAEIPNPTEEEIATLSQQIDHPTEKIQKWFQKWSQYKNSAKQKKCVICDKNFGFLFDWKKQLKSHITEDCQQTQNNQKCDKCDEKFSGQNWKKDLKRHNEVTHEKKPRISCDFCLNNYDDDSSLENHMKNEHPNENMYTKLTLSQAKPVLDNQFHEKSEKSRAKNNHKKVKSMEMESEHPESEEFETNEDPEFHEKNHDGNNGKKSKKCTFCDEIFEIKNNWKKVMRRHIERIHPNEELPEILIVKRGRPNMLAIEFQGNFQENVKNTSQTEAASLPETEQQSTGKDEIDEKVQDINKFLSENFETQTDDTETHDDDDDCEPKSNNILTNKCDICDKTFKGRNSKANLNRHVRKVHEKIRFECDFCKKSFADYSSVRLHIENSHPDKKLPAQFTVTKPRILEKCRFCNAEFEETEKLNIHEELCDSKINDPPIDNTNTDISIENISENVQSIQSTTNNLNLMSKCQHCKDSCSSKHLKIHEKTCNKYRSFIAKINNSNYQCQLCSKICSSRTESYKHVSKEHNDIINKKDDNFDTVSKIN